MKLNLVSGRDMCKILERMEFKRIRQVGSHVRYARFDGRVTVVPVHGNELLGRGLINEILKQTDVTKEEYERLRKKV